MDDLGHGTSCCLGYGQSARSATVRFSTFSGTSGYRETAARNSPSYRPRTSMGHRRPRSSRALGADLSGAGVLAVALPLADEVGDVTDDFFAVAQHDQVDEVGDRFGVVGA